MGADGTLQTHTIYEEVRVPAESQMVPTTVIRSGSFPLTATDRRSLELAARLRQTDDAEEQERLRGELTELLAKAFDERRKIQQQEMERLEARLKSIRELDQRRQELKDQIVERRLNELLGKGDELAWETSSPATIARAPIPSPGQPRQPTSLPAVSSPVYPGPSETPANVADDRFAPAGRAPQPAVARTRTPASPVETPNLGLIPAEQSFELAERILTLATETATWKHRLASAEEELDAFLKSKEKTQAQQPQYEIQDSIQAQREARERALAALRSRLVDFETKLRLAQIAWQGMGERLQVESEAAQRQVSDGDAVLQQIVRLHEQGATPSHQVDKAKQTSAAAKSQLQIAESRLRTWKESDGVLQERLKAILTPDAETDDTADTAQESAQTLETDEAAENDPS
ncbi:MAG: hypothetical protein EA381_01990 [Planctomycetaceae bacterium]|nr:MAG: hypothetical protein EA381_01990 [Planctomycetaceae bacterium]